MQTEHNKITKGDVFRYMVLPGIRPRLQSFFASGFQHVAFFMALVYQLVRLLPQGHPYANPANMGHFGIRHVIAEAANHLVFRWSNLDQIILFFVLLSGMIILLIQICTLFLSLAFAPVMAAPDGLAGFFVTREPRLDIAYMFMDMVFGVPDFFNSCVATTERCFDMQNNPYGEGAVHEGAFLGGLDPSATVPFSIHNGLHQMLQIYSYGLLVVAVAITIYFIFVIFAETAQTGTAFGKRFNKVWAPIRIVVAFGLLIPIGEQGLNASQYSVLYAAKFGSSFATNGWILFNDTLVDGYIDDTSKLLGKTNVPEMGALYQFLFTARTCHEYYKLKTATDDTGKADVEPYLVKNPTYANNRFKIAKDTTYESVLNFADGDAQLTLRFGRPHQKDNAIYKGFVKPLCGEMILTLADVRDFSMVNGTTIVEQGYFDLIQTLYFDTFANSQYPEEYVRHYTSLDTSATGEPQVDEEFTISVSQASKASMEEKIKEAIEKEAGSERWQERMETIEERGWAGAAIWYNSIAEMNGLLTTAILNVPMPSLYPSIMEEVSTKRRMADRNVEMMERYNPGVGNTAEINFEDVYDKQASVAFWNAYNFWQKVDFGNSAHNKASGNMLLDIINGIFGTHGLFDMRENTEIHPLAQISAMGRGLIDAAVQNIGFAMAGGFSGVLATAMDAFALGQALNVFAGFMVTIGTIVITIGWVLFYVVPFLPFIYFFFAVAGWVKGIFEAMLGAPLWALAHIRIDGDGLPGQAAVSGYALIFEIFIRPILIVFGFLGGIIVFAAMVQMLNEIFDLVTANLTGFNPGSDSEGAEEVDMEFFRGPLDEFMFTVIYAVIVYLMAMSSFKMIDTIPNQILRWMGQNVSAFNEQRDDPAQGLMGTAWIGGQQTFGAIGGGLGSVAGGMTSGGGKSQ